MKRVLILSPHPDDEAIGCGGTLRAHVEEGDHVEVIFLTSGEQGLRGGDPAETARLREKEAATAARILGYPIYEFWREPDGALKPRSALIRRLTEKLLRFKPHLLYLPHAHE